MVTHGRSWDIFFAEAMTLKKDFPADNSSRFFHSESENEPIKVHQKDHKCHAWVWNPAKSETRSIPFRTFSSGEGEFSLPHFGNLWNFRSGREGDASAIHNRRGG